MQHPLAATRNRLQNVSNSYQNNDTRVLCVCSAGLLRSPTLAHILQSRPYYFNCRAVGSDTSHALIPVDEALLEWADLVIAVDEYSAMSMKHLMDDFDTDKPIITMSISDKYARNDPKLVRAIKKQLKEIDDVLTPYKRSDRLPNH